MDWLVASGCCALGIVVGGIAWHFVTRMTQFDTKALGSVISIIAGAGVLTIFQAVAGKANKLPRELYCYPIGLLIGVGVVALLHYGQDEAWRDLEELNLPPECNDQIKRIKKKYDL